MKKIASMIIISIITVILAADPVLAGHRVMIATTPGVDKKTSETVKAQYDALPENIKEGIDKLDCSIVIFTYKDRPDFPKEYAGQCLYKVDDPVLGDTSIQLEQKNVPRQKGASFYHEVGHLIDYSHNGGFDVTGKTYQFSRTPEFEEIYNLEKDKFKTVTKTSDHNVMDTAEYFAEAFSMYFLFPNSLKRDCPKTAEYVKNAMETYRIR